MDVENWEELILTHMIIKLSAQDNQGQSWKEIL